MPGAFAFWLWAESGATPNTPPWLMPDGLRLHCRMKPHPPLSQALEAMHAPTATAESANRCPCPAMARDGSCACIASLEVARPYYCLKAGETPDTKASLPDTDCIRRMALCRGAEFWQVFQDVVGYRGSGAAAALYFEAKACELIAYLLEACAAHQPTRLKERLLCGEDERGIANVVAYLHTHLQQDLSLDSLCQIACMGKTKLKKAFRDVHECTLTDYLKQQRVLEAKRLLRETDLPIADIARAMGYLAGGRFAILFRHMTGYLPSEYRHFFR
jgi:AraC-like DNA-binding protein